MFTNRYLLTRARSGWIQVFSGTFHGCCMFWAAWERTLSLCDQRKAIVAIHHLRIDEVKKEYTPWTCDWHINEALALFLQAKCTWESERWGCCIWQSSRLTINSCSSSGSSLMHITSSASCFTWKNNDFDIREQLVVKTLIIDPSVFCFTCHIILNYKIEKKKPRFTITIWNWFNLHTTRYTHVSGLPVHL